MSVWTTIMVVRLSLASTMKVVRATWPPSMGVGVPLPKSLSTVLLDHRDLALPPSQ